MHGFGTIWGAFGGFIDPPGAALGAGCFAPTLTFPGVALGGGFFGFWGMGVEVTLAEEEPTGRDTIVADEVCEPCRLEDVTLRLLLASVEVPAVDAVSVGECFLAPDAPVGLESL